MDGKTQQVLKRYGVAVGLPVLAVVVRGLLPFPEGAGIYQLPLAAVVLAAWYGGRGPGWLACAISVVGAMYLLPPEGSFALHTEHALPLSIFAALCLLLTEFGAGRRRAEHALRESEARFRQLTDLSADWYWKQDESLRFTFAMDDRVGFAPVSLGKTRWELPGTPLSGSWDEHRAVLAARRPFRGFEYSRVDENGTTRYVSVSGVPVFDDQGAFKGYQGVASDITPRKVAEAERQAHVWFLESMDRINRAMQGTNDVERMMSDVLDAVLERFACDRAWLLYPCDPDAPSWRAVMEHTRPEYPGAFALGAALPADADTAAIFAAARASAGPVRMGAAGELPIPGHIAERFTIRSAMAMALHPKGDRPYLFGVHQCSHPRSWTNDEQRFLEEIGRRLTDALSSLIAFRGLRESEARLEAAQQVAHVGWWERDYATGHVSLSDEACRILGVRPLELPQWHGRWLSLIHPDDRQKTAEASEKALRGEARYDVEYRVVRPDGTVRFVHSQGDVTRDESGRALRQFGVLQDITELRYTERRLEAAQRLARVGWWERDFAGGRWLTSDEVARIFGIERMDRVMDIAEWTRVVPSIIHPDDRRRVLEAGEAALRAGRRYDIEYRIVHADGTVRVVHVQADVTLDEAGRPVRQFGVAQDITELRQAEREVRARQEMLELAQKAARAVAFDWYIGARESENRWSPELEAMYGLEAGTFDRTYKGWRKLIHPDDWPSVKEALEHAQRSGDVAAEYRVIQKDGAVRWLQAKGRMFFDAEGRPERMVGFMIDVTDRRQAEEELRVAEARFRTFVDHATDAFFLHDRDLTILDANRQACESLGYRREELIGMHPRDLDAGLGEASIAELARRVGGGETVTFETLHRRKDGSVFPVEIRAREFRQGERHFHISLVRDISERKIAQEALRETDTALQLARTELARVSRVTTLGELTASIAHEVNQPLGAMVTNAAACARWLAAKPADMKEARAALDNIVADGKRAGEIIKRIRGLTKRQAPRLELLDVNRKIHEVLALADHELRSHDIVLSTELGRALPRVAGDRVQLQQVLLNLIVNAIEAMSGVHDRRRELAIVSRRDASDVVVEVRDSGPGVQPERAEQMFEPFYTTKAEGIGIGLSISRSIIEAHGGRLWAGPNRPHGAAFCFALPVPAEVAA